MVKCLIKILLVPVLLFFFTSGCLTTQGSKSKESRKEKVISQTGSSEDGTIVQETIIEELPISEPLSRFSDIPVPDNFKLDRKKTFVYEAEGIKAGFLTYVGKSDLENLIAFYKSEMLPFQWKLINIFEFNNATMHFRKPGWNCTIQIQPSQYSKTTIGISVGPNPGDQDNPGKL